jgi:hypothetical protein
MAYAPYGLVVMSTFYTLHVGGSVKILAFLQKLSFTGTTIISVLADILDNNLLHLFGAGLFGLG